MMEHRLATSQAVEPIPPIDSPMAKLVYLYVDVAGPTDVSEMNDVLAMKKIAILSVLNALTSQSLVEETDEGFVTDR
ncbi:MAG: MarR family transcriptional regulator [Natrialbaceae archaeon]|nr:MarR family transcriptional regulator [Natrialbaceae archaeon]